MNKPQRKKLQLYGNRYVQVAGVLDWITQQRGSMCTEPGIIKAVIAMAHFIET
jgi:hypothetical protein